MEDLSDVCNADCDTSYSLLAEYRTHGHALGQAISTRCLPAGASEFCPSCGCHVPESVPHALLVCSHTRALTATHLPPFLEHMRAASPWWHTRYQSLSLDTERSRFILMSPCFPSSSRVRRATRRLVHEWLEDIRANHRLYSTFAAPKHITALNYY